MFNPLPFQQDAIDDLVESTIALWKKEKFQLPLVFKSPTGSGKTFVMANYVNALNKQPNWDVDKAFIWITFSDDLAMQSMSKFLMYFENTLENELLTTRDIDRGKLFKNNILFMNWQKVVSRDADSRLLRKPNNELFIKETGYYFEDFIDNTKKDNRSIILIIDEAHTNVTPTLAQQIIDYINPKIVIHVSATPLDSIVALAADNSSFVKVDRERVVNEGLIKESIVTQSQEDLQDLSDRDLDEVLIDLGLAKRESLLQEFISLDKAINPLLLIQLPNDDSDRVKAGENTKEKIVTDYLFKLGIPENKIGKWFDNHPKPDGIEDNDDNHDILLFKLAAGTGWDCPRAHVLVMFRNIKVEQRFIQTIGRILRMPEPHRKSDYKNHPNLRLGYLYTNYSRKDILENWIDKNQNKPLIYISSRKSGLSNVCLTSSYLPRIYYGDLSDSSKFQSSFVNSMNSYFGISVTDNLETSRNKIMSKGIKFDQPVINELIVDAHYSDFDMLNFDFKDKGHDLSMEMSLNDIEKTFNYFCFLLLKEQTEEDAKISNIARSWSPLKSAIRVWMKNVIDSNSNNYYRIFISDLQKGASSIFRPAITKALKDYKPIINQDLIEKSILIENKESPIFTIKDLYMFTDDFELHDSKLYVLDKFYMRKEYRGKINESSFISYLDEKFNSIEWWFKQETGIDYFGIKYFNTSYQKNMLFYPDWIIKFLDGRVGLFDTKNGVSAINTEGRARALALKLQELGDNFVGGIVVNENSIWYYNDSENYDYIPGSLGPNWMLLENLFKNI